MAWDILLYRGELYDRVAVGADVASIGDQLDMHPRGQCPHEPIRPSFVAEVLDAQPPGDAGRQPDRRHAKAATSDGLGRYQEIVNLVTVARTAPLNRTRAITAAKAVDYRQSKLVEKSGTRYWQNFGQAAAVDHHGRSTGIREPVHRNYMMPEPRRGDACPSRAGRSPVPAVE